MHGKRGITVDTALRLAKYFGTSAEFWVNLQSHYELDRAEDRGSEQIAAITPLNVAWPRGAAGSHPATFDERAVTCGWRAFWGEA